MFHGWFHLCLQKTGRVYQVGEDFFEFENDIINQLIEWNTGEFEKKCVEIDKCFIKTILLALLPKEELEKKGTSDNISVSDDIVAFIRGKKNPRKIPRNLSHSIFQNI